MASKTDWEFTSDCEDEGYTTKVTNDNHLKYLKKKVVQCINDSNDFSAEFHHVPGKPAKLRLSFGEISGECLI